MNKILSERLYAHVDFLTSLNPPRNAAHPESLLAARLYIQTVWEEIGLHCSLQEWKAGQEMYSNLIGSIHPDKQDRIIIAAHYDVFGAQPGADDNASGIAVMMELARLFIPFSEQLNFRVDFVAYCLEEPPYFGTEWMGSFVHAQSLFLEKTEILAMICLDMVGYFSDEENSQHYPPDLPVAHLPKKGNFLFWIGSEKQRNQMDPLLHALKKHSLIPVYGLYSGDEKGYAGHSDHRNFWHFGYPAVMLNNSSFFRNPDYHRPGDSKETLDYHRMALLCEALASMLREDRLFPSMPDSSM